MSGKRYTEEFKIEAVRQVTDRGHKVSEVASRLGITAKSLYDWIRRYGDRAGPICLDSRWTKISVSSIMSNRLRREAMRRKRRTHSPEFKAKVALAAIQGDLTMSELVKKFDVHANQITDWKKQLLNSAPDVFGSSPKSAVKFPS